MQEPIPLLDLRAQYQAIAPELESAALRVMRSGRYVLGDEVTEFEERYAAYTGTRHAIGVNSGTSALHLALLALGIGPGDEVITVPFTFVASVAAVMYTGATPVLVDVRADSLTMDPALLEAAITPRTKAIMPVHIYGQAADMDPILEVAARHHLPVVEDAAQAHGARDRGRRCGSIGTIGCFSFYPGKNLGALGEGGAVTTDVDAVADRIRLLRDWGAAHKYDHTVLGYNYRLDALQAALLSVKLSHLEEWNQARRVHADLYRDALESVVGDVQPVAERADAMHVYHVFAVRSPRREALRGQLSARGISTGVHYPIPVHLQEGYRLGYGEGSFPVAEKAAKEVLSLPIHAELPPAHRQRVIDAIREASTAGARSAQSTVAAVGEGAE
jgi:dTDP-4-amino-4,6-dideoxygalactose transaminase